MAPSYHHFPATRWTLLQVLREGSAEDSQAALELLCNAYWSPLYVVARKSGLGVHDAEDVVQGFFGSILEDETLLKADQSRGQLRSLLLRSFEFYRIKIWRYGKTLKRGGGIKHLPFSDTLGAEEHYLQVADDGADVETIYNREWARNVLTRSLTELRQQELRKSQGHRFDLLTEHLVQADADETLSSSAKLAGMTDTAFRQAVYRLRRSFREKIEDELAVTLGTRDPEVIRQEMMDLFKAFEK